MRKYFLFLVVITAFISCDQKDKKETPAASLYDTSYMPAIFADASRLEKIRLSFPVIDQVFKEYADSNHLPGVAYGLVVDGKLIYTGNIGYTDI